MHGRTGDPALCKLVRDAIPGSKVSGRVFRSVEVSQSGRWVAFASPKGAAIVLIDFDEGSIRTLSGHQDDVVTLSFSADETQLASGSVDGNIRLWDVRTGEAKGLLVGHLESVEALAFAPDGLTLASANVGIGIRFWHIPTQRELAVVRTPNMGYALVFSRDGRTLAVGLTAGGRDHATDHMELWEAPVPQAPGVHGRGY